MFKIKTFGNRNPLSGLHQIEKGFQECGCNIVDENPDILYHANGYFDDLLEYSRKYPKATKIGCLLDADPLNKSWGPPEMVRDQLLKLDIPTTISYTSQKQIFNRTGINCHVIYYPIKNLVNENYSSRGIQMLVVGRIYSENKRLNLIRNVAKEYCGDYERVVFVGPEEPPFGIYAGLVDNNMLNTFYNSSIFLLALSSVEGMYLPMLEACVTKTIPILTLDNQCVHEFGMQDFASKPDVDSIVSTMNHIDQNFNNYLYKASQKGEDFKEKFSGTTIAKNILNLYCEYKQNEPKN